MERSQIEDYFYKFGIFLLLGVGFLIAVGGMQSGFWKRACLPPCLFHLLTGYYCPGCGGTRAVTALLHGQLFLSVYYHPVVPYGAVVYLAFMVTQTIGRISRRLQIGMKFQLVYVWIALTILFINCVVKNVLHFTVGFVM